MLRRGLYIFTLLVFAAAVGWAQPPRVSNAKLETRTATPSLEKAFRATTQAQMGPAWVAYAVPSNAPHRQMCCGNWSEGHSQGSGYCRRCSLEKDSGFSTDSGEGSTKLEGSSRIFVLFRVENGRVGRILAISEDCELDAGGRWFFWLGDVSAAESVRLLTPSATAAAEEGDDRVGHSALAVIAFNGDPAADRALQSFVAPTQPVGLRRQAAF